jgi:hypothetical protein
MFLIEKYVDKKYGYSRTYSYNLSPVLIKPSVSDFIRINTEFGSTLNQKASKKQLSGCFIPMPRLVYSGCFSLKTDFSSVWEDISVIMSEIVVFIVFMTVVMVFALGWCYHVVSQSIAIANR